jgi:hypothetical protein
MTRFVDAASLWLDHQASLVEQNRRSPGTVETYRRQRGCSSLLADRIANADSRHERVSGTWSVDFFVFILGVGVALLRRRRRGRGYRRGD